MKAQDSIKGRFLVFSVLFFTVIVIAGTAAFLFSMKKIVRTNVIQELSRLIEKKRLHLAASVNQEISLVLKIADTPLIKSYFLQPDDPALEQLAFEEFAAYRRNLKNNTVFWINDRDKLFYFDDASPYLVEPDDPESYWYNMTLYETTRYNFNINYNS